MNNEDANNQNDAQTKQDAAQGSVRTYHCNDCGGVIYRHEVFCSNCGKKLDNFDFDD